MATRDWLTEVLGVDCQSVVDRVTEGGSQRLADNNQQRWCLKIDWRASQPFKQITLKVENSKGWVILNCEF